MILLVDDNDEFRLAAAEALRGAGLAVFEAADGEEALAIFAEEVVALLVTDLRLPGLHGEELARRCVRARPDLPVMVVSSHADADLPARLGSPRVEILGKPVRLARLITRCQALLRGEPAEWTASLRIRETARPEALVISKVEPTSATIAVAPLPLERLPQRRAGRLSRRHLVFVLAFTAVAAMALVGWSLGVLSRPGPAAAASPPAPLGVVEILFPTGPLSDPPTELAWQAFPRANRYRVRLLTADQAPLLDEFTSALRLPLDPALGRALQPVLAYTWQVEAQSASGQAVARSPAVRFRVLPALFP